MIDRRTRLRHICPYLARYFKDKVTLKTKVRAHTHTHAHTHTQALKAKVNLNPRDGGGSYYPRRDDFYPPLPRLRYIELIYIWLTGTLPYVRMIDRCPHLRHICPCLAKDFKNKVNLKTKGGVGSYHHHRDHFYPPLVRPRYIELRSGWLTGAPTYVIFAHA